MQIFTDNLENQLRQLGWSPARKLPIKLNGQSAVHRLCVSGDPCSLHLELAKNDLTPASTIFVPLPTSNLHYLVVRVSTSSIEFELLRLARELAENGVGMKLAIRDRSPMDLQRLRQRHLDAKGKRKREQPETAISVEAEPQQAGQVRIIPKGSRLRADCSVSMSVIEISEIYMSSPSGSWQSFNRCIELTNQCPRRSNAGGTTAERSRDPIFGAVPTTALRELTYFIGNRWPDTEYRCECQRPTQRWPCGRCRYAQSLSANQRLVESWQMPG